MVYTTGIDIGSTYTKCIILNESRQIVGRGLIKTGFNFPKAIEAAYSEALEKYPGYPFGIEHLAELRAAQGRVAEAVKLPRRLLRANPDPLLRLSFADFLENSKAEQERRRALVQMQ